MAKRPDCPKCKNDKIGIVILKSGKRAFICPACGDIFVVLIKPSIQYLVGWSKDF